jgi:catechol 2,3-dioxygenase-like lactoylglutathione lyase family enzyme
MTTLTPARVVQVGLCSADLPRTVRRYVDVFGFGDGGGEALWGDWLARMQGNGDDTDCLVWWLVGRQSLMQLELFHHSRPAQAPQAPDRTPADLGWVRWGLSVPDFDACVARLAVGGIGLISDPDTIAGNRRACFTDPDTRVVVEIMEDGDALPGGSRVREFNLGPALVYAAASVTDLAAASVFFADVVGLEPCPPHTLHPLDDDTLWGLAGASRRTAVFRAGGFYIELAEYASPVPRPKPAGYRVTDQGFMNIAIGFRDRPSLDDLVQRLEMAGYKLNAPLAEHPAGMYLTAVDGLSLEILSISQEFDGIVGFLPRSVPLRPGATR